MIYNLCMVDINTMNMSVLGHPVNVVLRTDSRRDVELEIKKHINKGCSIDRMLVFVDCEFSVENKVSWGDGE